MEFVLLLVSSLLLTARAAAASDPVLDVDGEALVRGQRYYARSVMRPGGGLTLAAVNGSCPLHVARAPFPDLWGLPLAFFPEEPTVDTVEVGSTLYIMFPQPTKCSESTVWTLDGKSSYVTTGGTSSATLGTHLSRFAIRKVGESYPFYQIEVCPCSIGVQRPSCRAGCLGGVGLISDGNNILLGINTDRPHAIHFVRVKEVAAN